MLPAPYVPDPTDEQVWLLKKCATGVAVISVSVFLLGGVVVLIDSFISDPAPLHCGWPRVVAADWTGQCSGGRGARVAAAAAGDGVDDDKGSQLPPAKMSDEGRWVISDVSSADWSG